MLKSGGVQIEEPIAFSAITLLAIDNIIVLSYFFIMIIGRDLYQKSVSRRWKASYSNLISIANHVEDYYAIHRKHPLPGHRGRAADLKVVFPASIKDMSFKDGFGHDIIYLSDQEGEFYALISLGKNGKQDQAFNIEDPPPPNFTPITRDNDDLILVNACWLQIHEGTGFASDHESYEKAYYTKLLRKAEDSLRLNPADFEAMRNKGIALCYKGDYQEAARYFEDSYLHAQFDDRALYFYGSVLFNLERFRESVQFLEQSLKNNGNYYEAQGTLSWACYLLGERDKAAKYWGLECKNEIKLRCVNDTSMYPIDLGSRNACNSSFQCLKFAHLSCGFCPSLLFYYSELLRYLVDDKEEAGRMLNRIVHRYPYFEKKLLQDLNRTFLDDAEKLELLNKVGISRSGP